MQAKSRLGRVAAQAQLSPWAVVMCLLSSHLCFMCAGLSSGVWLEDVLRDPERHLGNPGPERQHVAVCSAAPECSLGIRLINTHGEMLLLRKQMA